MSSERATDHLFHDSRYVDQAVARLSLAVEQEALDVTDAPFAKVERPTIDGVTKAPDSEEAAARERHTAKQQQLYVAFLNTTETRTGINPQDMDPRDIPSVAKQTHALLHNIVIDRIEKDSAISNPTFERHSLPYVTIDRYLSAHFSSFPEGLRYTSDVAKAAEDKWIATFIPQVRVRYFRTGSSAEGGAPAGKQTGPLREELYPELALARNLHNMMPGQELEYPRHAMLVLIACYGRWFSEHVQFVGQTALPLNRSTFGQARIIDIDQLPEAMQAENWPRGGGKTK